MSNALFDPAALQTVAAPLAARQDPGSPPRRALPPTHDRAGARAPAPPLSNPAAASRRLIRSAAPDPHAPLGGGVGAARRAWRGLRPGAVSRASGNSALRLLVHYVSFQSDKTVPESGVTLTGLTPLYPAPSSGSSTCHAPG